MKVCDLLEVLSEADPDDIVLFDSSSDSLLLIFIRSGMHQTFEDSTALAVGEEGFLRAMHIQW
jgi:hypothetical protein